MALDLIRTASRMGSGLTIYPGSPDRFRHLGGQTWNSEDRRSGFPGFSCLFVARAQFLGGQVSPFTPVPPLVPGMIAGGPEPRRGAILRGSGFTFYPGSAAPFGHVCRWTGVPKTADPALWILGPPRGQTPRECRSSSAAIRVDSCEFVGELSFAARHSPPVGTLANSAAKSSATNLRARCRARTASRPRGSPRHRIPKRFSSP